MDRTSIKRPCFAVFQPSYLFLANTIYEAAVQSVQAARLFATINLEGLIGRRLSSFRRVRVVGAGKAAMAMACALERHLDHTDVTGRVVVPHGYTVTGPSPTAFAVDEGGHPMPDLHGLHAAQAALQIARDCSADDLLIVLLSGGGSALWFAPSVRPEALRCTTALLLNRGATIQELNTVRRHLSAIKGGRLARAAYPAKVLTLAISDVIGDAPAVIASGPTVGNPSMPEAAAGVATRYRLWPEMPGEVVCSLRKRADAPAAADACFNRCTYHLIGSNAVALDAACEEARQRGYTAQVRSRSLQGEARRVGTEVGRKAACLPPGHVRLWGGETTVTVRGTGIGGRCQELVLAAAMELERGDTSALVLSAGTDGIDGPTDAAGAWATYHTTRKGRNIGLEPGDALRNNDAHIFFAHISQLVRTGPTHTNVMDITIAIAPPDA